MSLSSSYSSLDIYLKDVLQFLKEFQWIYTSSNTEFIAEGTLRHIPPDWISTIESLSLQELNEIPFDFIKESWPPSLQRFLTTLKKLKPPFKERLTDSSKKVNEEIPVLGIKSKKVHEISKLSQEIAKNCDIPKDSTIFIDLGCGVGHLTHFLHRNFQYKLLGVESDGQRVKTARNIQSTKFPDSLSSVKFVEHFIDCSTMSFIQPLLTKEFNLNTMCDLILIGLHACADLTVTSLNLFLRNSNVKQLFVMPCCYHKMKFKENSRHHFENVPLSQKVKTAQHAKEIINRPFLRLAGQQTAVRWKNNTETEHSVHGRNMFVRGAVQAVLNEDEIVLKNKGFTFESCGSLGDALGQYKLVQKDTGEMKEWSAGQREAFANLLIEYPNGGVLSEFLTCLQTSIQGDLTDHSMNVNDTIMIRFFLMFQSVCENLVLLDRLQYVEEEAIKMKLSVSISAKKIVKEDVSPRCFVIIGKKK